jgi:hypothetical protein
MAERGGIWAIMVGMFLQLATTHGLSRTVRRGQSRQPAMLGVGVPGIETACAGAPACLQHGAKSDRRRSQCGGREVPWSPRALAGRAGSHCGSADNRQKRRRVGGGQHLLPLWLRHCGLDVPAQIHGDDAQWAVQDRARRRTWPPSSGRCCCTAPASLPEISTRPVSQSRTYRLAGLRKACRCGSRHTFRRREAWMWHCPGV